MLSLAHMGIGSKLVSPWSRELPKVPILLGTVLPDLIDKPLFYVLLFVTRTTGGQLGYINNSRTIGHTGVLLLAITLLAVARRSRWLAALALGVATHLLLDNIGDTLVDHFLPNINHPPQHSAMVALLWPFFESRFPLAPFNSFAGHMHRSFNPLSLGLEVAGGAILLWEYWKHRHEGEIIQTLIARRQERNASKKRRHQRERS